MYKPDKIDWKIITILNKDGRISSTEISRVLGNISPRTVTNRINNLQEKNIINIRSIINPETIGYDILADIFIEVEPGELRTVADQLIDLPLISYIACATGETDIIISVRAKNINELYDFSTEVIGNIPGVKNTQTFSLPLTLKNISTWLPPEVIKDLND